jgi:hypothetical protein
MKLVSQRSVVSAQTEGVGALVGRRPAGKGSPLFPTGLGNVGCTPKTAGCLRMQDKRDTEDGLR